MPIFKPVRVIPVKSHVWKFGSDWLSLSWVIVSTDKKEKIIIIIEFSGGQKSPIGGRYIWHLMPIFELGWPIPVKSHVWKFGLDWLKSEVCKISGGRQRPPIKGGHMWPAMPIFVHGRAISVKSLVWKFGSDWLNISRVIVVTDKKNRIEFSGGQKSPISGAYIWPLMPIFELGWAIPVKSHVWKFGLDWFKSEVCKISGGGGRSPYLGGSHVTGDAHFRTWLSYFS